MKAFVLLVFIPSLIVADILCPKGKTTCPEGIQCCEKDGEYTCCDPDDDSDVPAIRLKVRPGEKLSNSIMFANPMPNVTQSKLSYCDSFTCRGKCCAGGCCTDRFATCCEGECCPALSICCNGGCCEASEKCCGGGCCDQGATCCGSFCCNDGYKCGTRFLTCQSKGINLSPEIVTLLLMAASVFIFRHL